MISLIDAGPGTGKTFCLTYGYQHLAQSLKGGLTLTDEQQVIFDYLKSEFPPFASVCFFAHSTSVRDKLVAALGKNSPAKVYTFHGAGLSCIIKKFGYQAMTSTRTERHIQSLTGFPVYNMPWEEKRKWYAVKRLVHYFKVEYLTPSDETLKYLLLKYPDLANYSIPSNWEESVTSLLPLSLVPDKQVEFADMVYMGISCISKPRFDLGFVDESQDVSASSYKLVTRLCKHVVFCGDKNQAINAFAGASEEMYNSIAAASDAILPLKMTQRCPPLICELANSVRPGGIIEGPNKGTTKHESIPLSSLPGKIEEEGITPGNSLFVARTNAAVIGLALFLHKKGVPVSIIDKDLCTEMTNFIKSFKPKKLSDLSTSLTAFERKSEKCRNAIWRMICLDKAKAIRSLMASSSSLAELYLFLSEEFVKTKTGLKLSTIHKAKGLEAKNILIFNPPIELPAALAHPIQKEQEHNLHFVALTRSALNLYWIKEE